MIAVSQRKTAQLWFKTADSSSIGFCRKQGESLEFKPIFQNINLDKGLP